MPSNLLKLSSSSMESEFHNRNDFERSGSFDSQGNHRSRSSNMDDDNLKYLTNEEKNALLFLEETLDAFEEDAEEAPVSVNSSFSYYSPRSIEDSHSDSDDIIDLVQTRHNHEGVVLDTSSGLATNGQNHTLPDSRLLDVTSSASAPMTIPASTIQREEDHLPEPPIDYPKFRGAVPTPVIIAQQISEKKAENLHLSSMYPKEEKSPEAKKSVATSPIGDGDDFVFPGSSTGKLHRFPNNISVKVSGKQYNKTIAKAAVNVQERKAKVLANLHGPALFAEEIDGKNGEQLLRRTSFRDVATEQARYEALTKLGLVKEMPIQANMQTTSASTSPVSNGQQFFPSEIKRRLSHEKVNTNTQHSAKILTPEMNTKVSYEHHVNNGQNPSKYFTTETKRIPSKEQDGMGGPNSPKLLAENSNRRLSNEQISTAVQHSPRILSPEPNKRISNEHSFSNGQRSSNYFSAETKRITSKEQDGMGGPYSPKLLAENPNRRLSNEQISTPVQHSPRILSPEPNKRISNEHSFSNGQRSSNYFTTETKRIPSKEQDDMSGPHSPKVLAEESNRRLSNEQLRTNAQHSPKVLYPEPNKRFSNEHNFSNGQRSSNYSTTETKSIPSKEQDDASAQHSPKVLAEAPNRRLSNEKESISRILRSEPSAFVSLGKTVVIKGDTAASSIDASKRHSNVHVNHEQKPPNTHQEIKRTCSLPRPTGFRSQGITVQFSGRDSSDESRKDALRKLGLLKEQSGQ